MAILGRRTAPAAPQPLEQLGWGWACPWSARPATACWPGPFRSARVYRSVALVGCALSITDVWTLEWAWSSAWWPPVPPAGEWLNPLVAIGVALRTSLKEGVQLVWRSARLLMDRGHGAGAAGTDQAALQRHACRPLGGHHVLRRLDLAPGRRSSSTCSMHVPAAHWTAWAAATPLPSRPS